MRDLKRPSTTNRRTARITTTGLILCLAWVWVLAFPESTTFAQQIGVDRGRAVSPVEVNPTEFRDATVGGSDDRTSEQGNVGDFPLLRRLGTITLDSGEAPPVTAVIDPAGQFAYFGTYDSPGRVVKIDLETFERVGAITLVKGEDYLVSAVMDPGGDFAYFGTETLLTGYVVKIDLNTFERVDAITLESSEAFLQSAAIEPSGDFAYFGTSSAMPQVVKIDLDTFERVGTVTLAGGVGAPVSAVIDPAGQFAYFGTDTYPGHVVKIDLDTFAQVDAITLDNSEDQLYSAAIDSAGRFAYFGTNSNPGQVVKVDLDTFERVDSITLNNFESSLSASVIDPAGQFAYFGTKTFPGRVVMIDLDPFERVETLSLDFGEDRISSAVIDPAGRFAFFGASDRIVKVGQMPFPPAALAVDSGALSSDGNGVFEPGEIVEMAPAWHNSSDEPALADGNLLDFVGPSGASYEIDVEAVEYVIPVGESGSCQDSESGCYQLQIELPGTERPAPHWDATADEKLNIGETDALEQTWILHVGDSFADVPRSHLFYTGIETLLHSGVTSGCGDGSAYCPSATVTRSQMPVFMLRALEDRGFTPLPCVEGEFRVFDDVPASNPFCPWIEALAHRGIVSGCGVDSYCPNSAVTRAQMAVFLLDTLLGGGYTPIECSSRFDDVPCPSLFADWVEDLAARGITSGCTATEYCPTRSVTRGQMAAFITEAFDLILYGP